MKNADENALRDAGLALRRVWWQMRGQGPVAAAVDVMEALGFCTKDGQRPVLSHRHRTPSGWHLAWTLPPGIASRDVLAKLDHFAEQAGGPVDVAVRGHTLHMDLHSAPIPAKVAFEWDAAAHEGMALPIPIGTAASGPVVVDLAGLPHLFVAGETGGGKTTFLLSVATALLLRGDVWLCVIDLKGLDFWFLRQLGLALVVDNDTDAMRLLAAVNAEVNRRKGVLQQAGCVKIQEYHDMGGKLPWLVLMVDELAELQDKRAQEGLNRLARLSRALGICLICATQRPSHTLFARFTDTRMLFSGRLVFNVPSPEDSRLLLGSDSAARIPPTLPGRAIWRHGAEVEVQCPNITQREARRLLAGLPRVEVNILDESGTKRLRP